MILNIKKIGKLKKNSLIFLLFKDAIAQKETIKKELF
jgi:hypothetical protein